MTLRHSLFDKIFISFLVIFTVCFGFIVLYASNVTRSMLVDDRTEVLTNEAFLIADQTVAGYVQGVYTKDELQESLRYYIDKLTASFFSLILCKAHNSRRTGSNCNNRRIIFHLFKQIFTGHRRIILFHIVK